MSDLIDRQTAIDAVIKRDANCGIDSAEVLRALPPAQPEYSLDEHCTDCKEYDQERHCCPRFNRVIRQTVEEMRTQQRWIPCSERLPEKTQLCLVTEGTVVGLETCTRCFNKRNDGGFWSGWGHTDVIAWMPLPEPYREEE